MLWKPSFGVLSRVKYLQFQKRFGHNGDATKAVFLDSVTDINVVVLSPLNGIANILLTLRNRASGSTESTLQSKVDESFVWSVLGHHICLQELRIRQAAKVSLGVGILKSHYSREVICTYPQNASEGARAVMWPSPNKITVNQGH
jgi:hypothetical protein